MAQQFTTWDKDKDGAVSVGELDRAIADAQTRGPAAAAAVTVRLALLRLKADKAGLTDAQALPSKTFSWALKRLQAAPRTLYAKESPNPERLRQGKLGDCFCLAGLRAVLERDPAVLSKMFTPLPDGGFSVCLGALDVPVPPLTDGEIMLGASAEDGLWPLVYEKAVGLYRTKPADRDLPPFAVVTRGGSAGLMMSKLTSNQITRWSCKPWRDASGAPERQAALINELRGHLKSAFSEKRLVTAGTSARPEKGAIPGITYNHGYTVLGYDETRDEVRLWNPHGNNFTPKGPAGLINGYPRAQGVWSAPLAEVVTFMGGFAFEKRPAAGTVTGPATESPHPTPVTAIPQEASPEKRQ